MQATVLFVQLMNPYINDSELKENLIQNVPHKVRENLILSVTNLCSY